MPLRRFQDLIVWKKAMQLTSETYRLVKKLYLMKNGMPYLIK